MPRWKSSRLRADMGRWVLAWMRRRWAASSSLTGTLIRGGKSRDGLRIRFDTLGMSTAPPSHRRYVLPYALELLLQCAARRGYLPRARPASRRASWYAAAGSPGCTSSAHSSTVAASVSWPRRRQTASRDRETPSPAATALGPPVAWIVR